MHFLLITDQVPTESKNSWALADIHGHTSYIYMDIHMYIYMDIHTYIYMDIRTYICMDIHTYTCFGRVTYTNTCMHACIRAEHTNTLLHASMHTYKNTYVHKYKDSELALMAPMIAGLVRTCVYIRAFTCIRMCTKIQTCKLSAWWHPTYIHKYIQALFTDSDLGSDGSKEQLDSCRHFFEAFLQDNSGRWVTGFFFNSYTYMHWHNATQIHMYWRHYIYVLQINVIFMCA